MLANNKTSVFGRAFFTASITDNSGNDMTRQVFSLKTGNCGNFFLIQLLFVDYYKILYQFLSCFGESKTTRSSLSKQNENSFMGDNNEN
tara:strand:+ start:139 stop:405 length:267 start_codon:yes stop_codon:yes gene_type:complete